jgi:hypothetical protein
VLLAAGCGKSSKPETAQEWANSFCSSVTTWKNSVTSTVSSLKGSSLTKDSITSAFDDFKSATKTFENDVKKLGKPPTKSGDQAKQDVDNLTSQVDDSVQALQSAVNNASSGAGGILSAVSVASTEFTKVKTEVQSTFQSLQQLEPGGELQQAFQQSESCKSLKSSSGSSS